jgi:hypothetical protein
MKKLIIYKLEHGFDYISISEAVKIIGEIQKEYSISGNLFEALLSENLLTKNIYYVGRVHEEGLYIIYERLEDHLIIDYLLKKASLDHLYEEFLEGGVFYPYIKDEDSLYYYRGLIDALTIQLPEKFGVELFEMVPNLSTESVIIESFIESMLWRKYETLSGEKIKEYINTTVFQSGVCAFFFETIISVATEPKHPFNAHMIHSFLDKFSLAQRDAFWTQLIYNYYPSDEDNSVKRLIEWSWTNEPKNYISDDSILLTVIMLSWFLASPNRKLRDCSTKAMICLLQYRIYLIKPLLEKFDNVNDPYIYERIFAAAYGSIMRAKTTQYPILTELCIYIYNAIFNKETVYPHILLRDYARGIIEYALHQKVKLGIDISKIRPPYNSNFPSIPLDDEIELLRVDYKYPDYEKKKSLAMILRSMQVEYLRNGEVAWYGDFGRYVFQAKLSHWPDLNSTDLMNIAIKRIMELGYDFLIHGEFDAHLGSGRNRRDQYRERIGKKYQWVALHELLAQVADKYDLKKPWTHGDNGIYEV